MQRPRLPLRIAVIGAGNIGSALIGGILKSGISDRDHLVATTRTAESARRIQERYGIRATAEGNVEAAQQAEIIILAVKPYALVEVLGQIRDVLREDQLLISLAAGFPLRLIQELVSKKLPIFRAMPNIPVVVDEGATAISFNSHVTQQQIQLVESIFRAVGTVCVVDDEQMHAVTALSGSGPAYVYMVIEALIAGGVKMGLSREIATKLAEQTVLGAAKLVRETMLHPAILRDQVTTPAGVTIAAIHELERHGLRAMLISAVETATRQSEHLEAKIEKMMRGKH